MQVEDDFTFGSFASEVIKVSFNKDARVFNYEKNSSSSTHTSDLNNLNEIQVMFEDTLEDEFIPNSHFSKTRNTNDNPHKSPRRLTRKMKKSSKDTATTLLESAEETKISSADS